jgi:hypothetical protein
VTIRTGVIGRPGTQHLQFIACRRLLIRGATGIETIEKLRNDDGHPADSQDPMHLTHCYISYGILIKNPELIQQTYNSRHRYRQLLPRIGLFKEVLFLDSFRQYLVIPRPSLLTNCTKPHTRSI